MRYFIKTIIFYSLLLNSTLCMAKETVTPDTAPHELVRQLMVVWQTADMDILTQIIAPDALYEDVPNHVTYKGIEGFKKYVAHVHSWADDVQIDIISSNEGVNFAVAEWRMQAIQARPIANRVPLATGRKINIRGVTIVKTQNERITHAVDYIDVVAFMTQLGFTFIPPTEGLIGQNPPAQE